MAVPANPPALMLGLDTASHLFDISQGFSGVANPQTTAFTCASDATLLVLSLISDDVRTGGAPTYNGVTMTQAGSTRISPAKTRQAELWYLPAPATGASHTVSVPNTTNVEIIAVASSYISSSGASALDVAAGSTGSSALAGQSITPTQGGCAVVDACTADHVSAPTANSQTSLMSSDAGGYSANAQYALADSTSSLAFTWTLAASDAWATQIASFKTA